MKISVIIAAYNVAAFVSNSIKSILTQQADCEIEIIVVDDGSTDGTSAICDSFIGNNGVKVIHKPNGGLSSARNAGIDAATGDYVMFLDGDDYLVDGALAYLVQINKNTRTPFDFIQYKYVEVDDYNYTTPKIEELKAIETVTSKHEIFKRKLSLGGIGASACTKLIKRNALEHIRFKEGIIHEDEQFTARLIDNIKDGVIFANAELYCYVMRPGSIIKSNFTKKKLDIVPVLEEQISTLENNGYDDLATGVRSRLFVGLCLLYIGARGAGDNDSSRYITSKAIALTKKGKMSLSRKFSIIASGLKYHLPMLQCYYIFKKQRNG